MLSDVGYAAQPRGRLRRSHLTRNKKIVVSGAILSAAAKPPFHSLRRNGFFQVVSPMTGIPAFPEYLERLQEIWIATARVMVVEVNLDEP